MDNPACLIVILIFHFLSIPQTKASHHQLSESTSSQKWHFQVQTTGLFDLLNVPVGTVINLPIILAMLLHSGENLAKICANSCSVDLLSVPVGGMT